MKIRNILILLSTLSLLSCAVGPDYKTPDTHFSDKWSTSPRTRKAISTDPIDLTWWKQFNDPMLDRYIDEAVKNNLTIKYAEANISNARALRQISASAFYPQVDATLADQSKRISQRGSQIAFFRNLRPQQVFLQRRFYNAGFDSSWELDLFGQTRREVEAQDAYIGQEIAAKRKVLLTVIADVARSYLEYRGTQQLILFTKKNIRLQKQNYSVINERYQAGDDNDMDVSLAKSEWTATQAQLPDLVAQLYSNAYQLAVLLGRDPQDIMNELDKSSRIAIPVKRVPVGLRSDILQRRPDVSEAERMFAQSIAEIGVAVAEQYPKFTIVGNIGYDTTSLRRFFYSTSSNWLFGPSVSLPIFRGGAIRANIVSKKALADAALFQYEETVLEALQDADTALVRYGQGLETYKRLKESVASSRHTMKLTRLRYRDGEDDVLALITAQQGLYTSEINLINAHTRSLTNLVSLYKALGGGWKVFEYKPGCCKKRA